MVQNATNSTYCMAVQSGGVVIERHYQYLVAVCSLEDLDIYFSQDLEIY